MDKVFFSGTHRVRHPAETWDRIAPSLRAFGVTRIADVTGLDSLGIPVVMAVRPTAPTLSVAQGKGSDLLLAKVSGAMEAIEFWHAEKAAASLPGVRARAVELDLPYPVTGLTQRAGGLLTDRTPLDWVEAVGALSGRPVPVPRDAVVIDDLADGTWHPPGLLRTTNGLASGNTRTEAVVHALHELIERDSVHAVAEVPVHERTHLDLSSVTDPDAAPVLERFRAAGAWLEVVVVPNRWNLPCFAAYVWSHDFPVIAAGSGLHTDPTVALLRAVTEAAQSRLTAITGTRDDLDPGVYGRSMLRSRAPVTAGEAVSWDSVRGAFPRQFRDTGEELRFLAAEIEARTGHEPLVVDLSGVPWLGVVKVVVAGLAFDARHSIPRPRKESLR
ncbi:YcaO-like family protein [Streptomyces sp. URMC 123]|uniref:YcaO-like family protein n=1 Tax=Streptomyces sp. URMC 123 TaxID=3423403 RepID=UPI003F19C410